jgi:hypothetical protein
MVDSEDIRNLYGAKDVRFTLQSFEKMNNDRGKLRTFRKELKGIKSRLIAHSEFHRKRGFVPSTFDEMMQDFGSRHERKELLDEFDSMANDLIE